MNGSRPARAASRTGVSCAREAIAAERARRAMSFTILLLAADADPSWPEKIRQAVPGAVAKIYADPKDALADIETADAAYGTVPPELFARAKRLRWICANRAGFGRRLFLRCAGRKRCRRHRHARQLQRASLDPCGGVSARLCPALRPLPAAAALAARPGDDRPAGADGADRRGRRRRRRGRQAVRRVRHAGARHRPAGERSPGRHGRARSLPTGSRSASARPISSF